MNYTERWLRIGKMSAALAKHLLTDEDLERGDKRQAAYIIEGIDPLDCVNLDPDAHRIEGFRRQAMRYFGATLLLPGLSYGFAFDPSFPQNAPRPGDEQDWL